MRLVAPLLLLAACAPPPPVDGAGVAGEPSISLVYPPDDTTELMLDADGTLRFLVVVDLEDLDFLPPDSDPDADDVVDGQGHWHLELDPTPLYEAPEGLYAEAEVEDVTPGTYRILVYLTNNNHTDLVCDTCEDGLEIDVVPFAADGT